VITHLEVRDFRGFAKLDLKELQRVNLIVGKNNSGKTSLLEAIVMACQPKRVNSDLPGLLRAHPGNLDNYFRWVVRDGAEGDAWIWRRPKEGDFVRMAARGRGLRNGEKLDAMIYESPEFTLAPGLGFNALKCRVLSVQQRDPQALVDLLGRAISRKGGEEAIQDMLRAVDPRLSKIRINVLPPQQPFIQVDLGLSELLPLAQAGQGMSRLVAMFSELLGEAPQICLIDEIENGIHHTLLEQVWRGIAVAARELNVQVFATTHSHECIVAAHEAMAAGGAYDFSIIQLFRYGEGGPQGAQARVLDRRLIEAAIKGEVDLR
jgi:hypothetical protein